jgi:hypothetical protein
MKDLSSQKLEYLSLDCLNIHKIEHVSLPLLHTLQLQALVIGYPCMKLIFQEVCSTLVHLVIIDLLLVEDPVPMNITFTALKSIELEEEEEELHRYTEFYKELVAATTGSAQSLKSFKSYSRVDPNVLIQLKNLEVFHCGSHAVEFSQVKFTK